jgi:hypothetical protein
MNRAPVVIRSPTGHPAYRVYLAALSLGTKSAKYAISAVVFGWISRSWNPAS